MDVVALSLTSRLVVDDSHDLRSYIAGLLQKLYNVVQFSDGQAAYDYAIANPPSLVLVSFVNDLLDLSC